MLPKGLLISCATPAASWPTIAKRSERMSCSSLSCTHLLLPFAQLGDQRIERGSKHLYLRRRAMEFHQVKTGAGDHLLFGCNQRPQGSHDRLRQPIGYGDGEQAGRCDYPSKNPPGPLLGLLELALQKSQAERADNAPVRIANRRISAQIPVIDDVAGLDRLFSGKNAVVGCRRNQCSQPPRAVR